MTNNSEGEGLLQRYAAYNRSKRIYLIINILLLIGLFVLGISLGPSELGLADMLASLQAGGSDMLLRGLSQDQELLPLYLESLGRSKTLQGREFGSFDLQRDDSGLLAFRLASRAAQEGDDE